MKTEMADDEASAYDRFLIDEGLELLHHFRLIQNNAVRKKILSSVKALADADTRYPDGNVIPLAINMTKT